MITPKERESIINARWRMLHAGKWLPVTMLLRGQETVYSPQLASSCVAFFPRGEGGQWSVMRVDNDVFARRPGEALEGLPWQVKSSPADSNSWEDVT